MTRLADVLAFERRWGHAENPLRVQQLLDDAATIVAARAGMDQTSEEFAALAEVIVCAMVHRAIGSAAPGVGVTAMSQSANGYTESLTFDDATGALYLTGAEKRLLQVDTSRAGFIAPSGEGAGTYD